MQFVLFYFSGTGNTELLTEEIKKKLESRGHKVECLSIEEKERLKNVSLKSRIIGFGFPVYKFSYPDIFNNALSEISRLGNNNKYFQFSTYARFAAESFHDFSVKLNKYKFQLIAEESFKAPSCGISARKPETDFEYKSVMFFEDGIDKKLDNFIDRILLSINASKLKIKHRHSIFNNIKLNIVKNIEKTKYPELQIDKTRCRVCGLCSGKCPDLNLVKRDKHIEIKDKYNCLHCLRCMNHCPFNAISFGKLTIGENRYTIQLRDKLFEKAVSGYKEEYWKNFDFIIRQWRKKTIKYWWTHRKSPEI